jgi:hypothetical protein
LSRKSPISTCLGGHFIKAVELDYPDDISAAEAARQLVDGHIVEPWSLDRKIAQFDRKPE